MTEQPLSFIQLDRAIGAVLGSAVGDALGAGFEFATPPRPSEVRMRPGTLTGKPAGHWTDDTAMAVSVLRVAATLGTLATPEAQTAVAQGFLDWFHSSPQDVGAHTARVLSKAPSATALAATSAAVQQAVPHSAGNGSLMRTGPVALSALGNDALIAATARAISALTHAHQDAQDACVLWSIAIDRAIRLGSLEGPRAGLSQLSLEQATKWTQWIDEAETQDPQTFSPNGYVVTALQAAWSAIVQTKHEKNPFEAGLRRAIAIGDDTDTVAAIAGTLLGAVYGVTSIPFAWRHDLAGWPDGIHGIDLMELAVLAARGVDPAGWPGVGSMANAYRHFAPAGATYTFDVDPDVVFGDFGALATANADAFLSLCRIGEQDRRATNHELVWLLDQPGNADAARVLADTADAIAHLRQRGQRVFVHCVQAQSRTPTVAMAWLMRHHGLSLAEAEAAVMATITSAAPEASLLAAVRSLTETIA